MGRKRNDGGGAAPQNRSFASDGYKVEAIADVAAAANPGVTAPVRKEEPQKHTCVALHSKALVDLCVHAVVPFCVAVLQSVELTDIMPITTGCGIFDRLLRWALKLKSTSTEADLNSLLLCQQELLLAVDKATVSRLIHSLNQRL